MLCRLYIKQASSSTSGHDEDDDEWAEYKIKETNMFTVEKYQQVRLSFTLRIWLDLSVTFNVVEACNLFVMISCFILNIYCN